MRCTSVVATMFLASLLPVMRVPEQLAWSPTESCLAKACRKPVDALLSRPDASAISRVLQMREEMSGMS
jgi:hypothetical protein